MNDTIILIKVPGAGPEFWVISIIPRVVHDLPPYRMAAPNREHAIKVLEREHWVGKNNNT